MSHAEQLAEHPPRDSLAMASLPQFRQLPPPPTPIDDPPADSPPTPGGAPGGAQAAGTAGTGISTPEFFKSRAKSYAKIAEALLAAAGGWLNMASGEPDSGAFLPDDDDEATIPPPLGRIAARRIKIGDPGNLTDIEDIGMAAVGLGVWLAKGITAMLSARRERRRAAAGAVVHDESGNG